MAEPCSAAVQQHLQSFSSRFLSESCDLSWFAIQTRPRYEKKVATELDEKGIVNYLPLTSVKHQWTDRRTLVQLPLFPSYLFVRISGTAETRVSVLRTNGVARFVGVRGKGASIPDSEIAAVQAVLGKKVPFEPHPYVRIGQRVRIRGGALEGITGVLLSVNGDQSLVISVELIQKSISMRVSGYKIEDI